MATIKSKNGRSEDLVRRRSNVMGDRWGREELDLTLHGCGIEPSVFDSFVRALARFSAQKTPDERIAHSTDFKTIDSKAFDI